MEEPTVQREPVMEEQPDMREAWGVEVLALLRVLVAEVHALADMVVRLAAYKEIPGSAEPAAASMEPPGSNEPLPTWILTDERVHGLEEAIEREQRVRGQAYGG